MLNPSLPSTACLSNADDEITNQEEGSTEVSFAVDDLPPPDWGKISIFALKGRQGIGARVGASHVG